jgi:hypothetical protein
MEGIDDEVCDFRCAELSLMVLLLRASARAQEPTASISSPHKENIQKWLSAHPGYRLATAADCYCDEDIESLRKSDGAAWEPQPDFHPYFGTGDFDGDGSQDVAVVAISRDEHGKISVVVSFDRHSAYPCSINRRSNIEPCDSFTLPSLVWC